MDNYTIAPPDLKTEKYMRNTIVEALDIPGIEIYYVAQKQRIDDFKSLWMLQIKSNWPLPRIADLVCANFCRDIQVVSLNRLLIAQVWMVTLLVNTEHGAAEAS